MVSINQQDLNVRLQLVNCCLGTKASELIDKIKIGAKDSNCKLQDLQVGLNMLKYLACYKVDTEEVQSQGYFQVTTATAGFTLEIFIDGVSITGPQNITSPNRNTIMTAAVAIINSYQDVYTATLDTTNDLYKVIISGPCEGGIITYETDATKGEIVLGVEDLSGGICKKIYNNCLTEDQVLAMFDFLSTKCGICFQPLGFNYEQ